MPGSSSRLHREEADHDRDLEEEILGISFQKDEELLDSQEKVEEDFSGFEKTGLWKRPGVGSSEEQSPPAEMATFDHQKLMLHQYENRTPSTPNLNGSAKTTGSKRIMDLKIDLSKVSKQIY